MLHIAGLPYIHMTSFRRPPLTLLLGSGDPHSPRVGMSFNRKCDTLTCWRYKSGEDDIDDVPSIC